MKGARKSRELSILRNRLDYNGFSYFNDKEGYSVLIILYDKQGREIYGAYVPLQSLKQKDGRYLYTTGTKDGPGSFPFPQGPMKSLFALQLAYKPSKLKERGGEAFFQVWPLAETGNKQEEKPLAEGKAAVGEKFQSRRLFSRSKGDPILGWHECSL